MTIKKLLLFKLASINEIYYLTLKYLSLFDNLEYYFLMCDENITDNFIIDNKIIKYKLKENNWSSLLIKVINALNYFKNNDYEYIVVSNISTLINIHNLEEILNSKKNCYSVIGNYSYNSINYNFPSGALYIFDIVSIKKICNFFNQNNYITDNTLSQKFIDNYPSTDDIFFGYFMYLNKILITPINRYDCLTKNIYPDNYNFSHYRIKTNNYKDDCKIMLNLLKIIYDVIL
jgi:hypothetical protein